MWNQESLPDKAKSKSLHLQQVGLLAANTALSKGLSENEATFACLSAIKAVEAVQTKDKPLELLKAKPRAIPQHVAAVLNKAVIDVPSNTVASSPTTPAATISTADFDTQGHLVITMTDGERIVTKGKAIEEHIQQSNMVQINPVFDYIRFNTEVNKPPYEQGLLFYDKLDHSLAYFNDDSNVTVNIGREQLIRVYNHLDSTILDGTVVYVNGVNTGWPTIGIAKADTKVDSQGVIGLVTGPILSHTYGYVCTAGVVNGLNTSAYSAGTILYLSATSAGGYTAIPPLQPNYDVEIGIVVGSDAITGSILVHVDKKDWYPSLELLETTATLVLPTVPSVFKPTITVYNDGFTYDNTTGVIEILNSASYGISMQFNAQPSASNKYVYFYVEEDSGNGWEIKRYSARKLELPNAQETELLINADRYYKIGTKLRFYIWGDATITLKSTDLPGTTAGTVTLPAYRFLIAG